MIILIYYDQGCDQQILILDMIFIIECFIIYNYCNIRYISFLNVMVS